jgi:hypothetical protein
VNGHLVFLFQNDLTRFGMVAVEAGLEGSIPFELRVTLSLPWLDCRHRLKVSARGLWFFPNISLLMMSDLQVLKSSGVKSM